MKRFLAILFVVLSFTFVLVSCGDKVKYDENYVYDGTSLLGSWQERDFDDEYYQIYTFHEKKVILTSYSYGIMMQEIEADYKIEGDNTLVISWGDGYIDRNDFSISKHPVLVISQIVSTNVDEMQLVPCNTGWNKDNSAIVGTWINDDNPLERFDFKSDYTLVVDGEYDTYSMPYAVKDDYLALGGQFIDGFKENVSVLNYKINGDTLTLTGVDKNEKDIVVTFTREK